MNAGQLSPTSGQFLTFGLNEQLYAVPIGMVREINRVSEITPIPKTPEYLSGVMDLRGKVIPVINLRMKLDFEKIGYTKETCIIVIESEIGQIGMVVDTVRGVIELGAAQIEPAPTLGDTLNTDLVLGVGKHEEQVIILLDITKALSVTEIRELAAG